MSLVPPQSSESLPSDNVSTPLPPTSKTSTSMSTIVHDLGDLHVLHYGKYVNIYQGPDLIDQVAYKAIRVVPSNRKAVSRVNSMIHALLHQQARIDQLQNDHISSVRAAKTTIAGIAVPAVAVRWYKHGNMLAYTQRNPHVNKLDLVIDLANGLAGLHSVNIIHGNLHPGNVVITDHGRASITDVGTYASVMMTTPGNRIPIPSQWSYKSPEELLRGLCTLPTDVYSFACTVYTLYAGHCPIKCSPHSYAQGIQKIVKSGHGPLLLHSKPTSLHGGLWTILRRCWEIDPALRPTMETVENELRELAKKITSPLPACYPDS